MTCRHCSQTPIKNTLYLKPSDSLSEDVIIFLQEWLKVKRHTFSVLYFWGGEPLLYWETIKKYILLFESKEILPTEFRIFSNGLLLNDEIADFCNNHRIHFTLSYDAPDPLAVRNAVPSADNIGAFKKIEKRTVNSVFNALNDDLVAAFNMLEKLFPNTEITMGIINILSEIPKDIYDFKEGQIEKAIDTLADDILAGNDLSHNRFLFFRAKFVLQDIFRENLFKTWPWPPCAPGLISLSVKFNGDIVCCHNSNYVIANLKKSPRDILHKHLDFWRDLLPEKCSSCPVVTVCRNRCPIGLFTADKTEYVNCDILRRIYGSIMRNRERLIQYDNF